MPKIDPTLLREQIIAAFEQIQARVNVNDKEDLRLAHRPSVDAERIRQREWIRENWPAIGEVFADGRDVEVQHVRPVLIPVETQSQADIFRMARLTWSLPYSRGYGRRLRFLVVDEHNSKLIGILGFQSPPLDFAVRDTRFTYVAGSKVEIVNQMMDAYAVGAVPPYSFMLGGKLVALAMAADEVNLQYSKVYGERRTEMENRILSPELIAVTTTSAFGRSSIYNRLTYNGETIVEPIGYTLGYGSFHLSELYPSIRQLLVENEIDPGGGFGVGPRSIWQNYTRAFQLLGIKERYLRHGLQREVFLVPHIRNLDEYISDTSCKIERYSRPFQSLALWWKSRWFVKRADSTVQWNLWSKKQLEEELFLTP